MKRILLLLLFVTPLCTNAMADLPVDQPRVYVDGRMFSDKSVMISAKGELMFGNIHPVTGEKETRKFRVVIKRTMAAGNFAAFVYDIRYNDGEVFNSIDIEKILLKTQVGDEILVVPVVEPGAPKENGCSAPIKIVVSGGNC